MAASARPATVVMRMKFLPVSAGGGPPPPRSHPKSIGPGIGRALWSFRRTPWTDQAASALAVRAKALPLASKRWRRSAPAVRRTVSPRFTGAVPATLAITGSAPPAST